MNENTIEDNDEIDELQYHSYYQKMINRLEKPIDNFNKINYSKIWTELCEKLEQKNDNLDLKKNSIRSKINELNYHWKNNLIKLTPIGPSLNYEDSVFYICIKKEILDTFEEIINIYDKEFLNLRFKLSKYIGKKIYLKNNQKLFIYNDSLVWTNEIVFAKIKILKK